LDFDLPQIQMLLPGSIPVDFNASGFTENASNAARGGLGDLNENALVFVANHVSSPVIVNGYFAVVALARCL
jgi:hypothetical protein